MAEQDWYGKEKFTQIDLSNGISKEVTYAWLPAAVGFAAGGLFLVLGDYVRRPSALLDSTVVWDPSETILSGADDRSLVGFDRRGRSSAGKEKRWPGTCGNARRRGE